MKIKTFHLLIVLCSLFVFSGLCHAAEDSVELTGTAYGNKVGLLHFDYMTAKRPSADPKFDDPSYYIGPTKQFYIDPTNPDYTGPGDTAIVAGISVKSGDCDTPGCLLKGFVWSDTIGWIVLDGKLIEASIVAAGGTFPTDLYPRIKKSGALTGFAWNQSTGWVRLSSDNSVGTTTKANSQNVADWGAWLDIAAKPKVIGLNEIGRPLHGYIWSENLGWIKLGIETTAVPPDTFAFDFGAYTIWSPDDTSPAILASDLVWFAIGVNTGYMPSCTTNPPPCCDPTDTTCTSNTNTIVWKKFADDPESGIDVALSKFTLKHTDDSEPNCIDPILDTVKLSRRVMPDGTLSSFADLTVPVIGNLNTVASGFCKYALTGKVVNNSAKLATYIGYTYIPSPAPIPAPVIDSEMKVVYTRAGNPALTKSSYSLVDNKSSALADGIGSIGYSVKFKDVASNPIIPIPVNCGSEYSGCPKRDLKMEAELTNQLGFDMTDWPPTTNVTPVKYGNFDPGVYGTMHDRSEAFVDVDPLNLEYPFLFSSYAPSSSFSSLTDLSINAQLQIQRFKYEIANDPLPATTQKLQGGNLVPDPDFETPAYTIKELTDPLLVPGYASLGNEVGFISSEDVGVALGNLNFNAPITTSSPQLTTGGLAGVLSLGVPGNLTYKVNNWSSLPIANAPNAGGVSIDNIFYYGPKTNLDVPMMETHRIDLEDPTPSEDSQLAWSDPIEGWTRYELYDGESLNNQPFTSDTTPFHGFYQRFNKDQALFCYDTTSFPANSCEPPNAINPDSTYAITGLYGIPQEISPKVDANGNKSYPYPEKAGVIDRSDKIELGLEGTPDPDTPKSLDLKLQFTPAKFIASGIEGVQLNITHEIAYRYAGQPLFSIYGSTFGVSYDVKDIGVEARGTVAGTQIITGRKFDTVGTASTKNLQEQIRRNVANMTSGINKSACTIPAGALDQFNESPGPCVIKDNVNNTLFAYYQGKPEETLILGNGTTDLIAPKLPYTIIVKGGANVFIKDNIAYSTDSDAKRSSLGIIIIAGDTPETAIGKGSNLFISPEPTNLVGVAYVEGSLLSKDDNGYLFYGGADGSVQDLKNQLYWQGSIASRNTIAGAGIQKVPEGLTCLGGDTRVECAQRYDLDYLRRFTVSIEAGTGNTSIANNGLFSGGGSCASGTCTTTGLLPSVVTLKGGNSGQIDKDQSELAPFFIEPDVRTTSNPPPGFTVAGEQGSVMEIR